MKYGSAAMSVSPDTVRDVLRGQGWVQVQGKSSWMLPGDQQGRWVTVCKDGAGATLNLHSERGFSQDEFDRFWQGIDGQARQKEALRQLLARNSAARCDKGGLSSL